MSTQTSSPEFLTRVYKLKTSTVTLDLREVAEDKILDPFEAATIAFPLYAKLDADREHFSVLLMDTKHRVFGFKILYSGTIDSCSVYIRDIMSTSLRMGASAIVAVHNHPSGETDPSSEDRKMCADLKAAGALLGVTVLDFIILGAGRNFFSAANQRLI